MKLETVEFILQAQKNHHIITQGDDPWGELEGCICNLDVSGVEIESLEIEINYPDDEEFVVDDSDSSVEHSTPEPAVADGGAVAGNSGGPRGPIEDFATVERIVTGDEVEQIRSSESVAYEVLEAVDGFDKMVDYRDIVHETDLKESQVSSALTRLFRRKGLVDRARPNSLPLVYKVNEHGVAELERHS